MPDQRTDVQVLVSDPGVNMQTHGVDESPEIPGHRTPNLALALQKVILLHPLEASLNSSTALVTSPPLGSVSGDPGKESQVVLFAGVEHPPVL